MPAQQMVLLVGGTGRTGQRVLEQLLSRGASVRVIVRSPQKLRTSTAKNPNLTVIEADLLSLSDDDLRGHLRGCDAVISCLGHVISFRGVSVNHPAGRDVRRGVFEKMILWLIRGLVPPARSNMSNVAHFMCELVANPAAWHGWRGQLPVIINGAV